MPRVFDEMRVLLGLAAYGQGFLRRLRLAPKLRPECTLTRRKCAYTARASAVATGDGDASDAYRLNPFPY